MTERKMLLGRDAGCEVRITDPFVSRRHCEIWLSEDAVYIKDLGSSNAVLVNGIPVRESRLRPGAELSLGGTVLTVVEAEPPGAEANDNGPATPSTLPLADSVFLQASPSTERLGVSPRTVCELHELFTLGRKLSREITLAGLLDSFTAQVMKRFRPAQMWIAAYIREEDNLLFYAFSGAAPPDEADREAMLEAVRGNAGSIVPRRIKPPSARQLETTIIAPVVHGDDPVGVVALRTYLPQGVYCEDDLKYLIAASGTFAPYVRAVERLEQLRRERAHAAAEFSCDLVGQSPEICKVRDMARKAAQNRLPIILHGESGTGKELVARMIHEQGTRAHQPYVAINCAAIPVDLFESEMFGHEKGAFTGAVARRIGRFEESHGGTLLLDEITDLSLDNQARMLRVLENGAFYRVGGAEEIRVDTRIIVASNKPLEDEVAAGRFRSDLYYRLNGIRIDLPPLRSIPSDIQHLAMHFLDEMRTHMPRAIRGFSPEALERLRAWPWPGNARELRACIQRAVFLCTNDVIQPEDLGLSARHTGVAVPAADATASLADLERDHIIRMMNQCGGRVKQVAQILGISRVTLYSKLQRYGIEH